MPQLTFADQTLTCSDSQTVLDALLDAGIAVPFGCRQGVCQSCMLRATEGEIPAEAQHGLSLVKQKQGYFLSCRCHPEQDMTISQMQPEHFFTSATVIDKQLLNSEIVLITLECSTKLDYFAGQFVNLRRPDDGLTRSYSIANSRRAKHRLSFHIRKLPGGQFSSWVYEWLKPGDSLEISQPTGESCYTPEQDKQQSLLLIGTGTGLAPLVGIIHEALEGDHAGDIHVYHGSHRPESLYWLDEMQKLANAHNHIHYTPCVSRAPASAPFSHGRAHDIALRNLPDLKGWRVYLCGHPDMVKSAKQQAFLQGASLRDIHADPFLLQN
ncbi:MAG: 2Fe-2S iron-sulfur cluster-binding protein [Methylococcales bacterium]|nr:2Fe-2S iron-sulfur cluster-binding protein [Methylococcales bacterium]